MKENWDDCFEMVLKHEGGYVNDPRDPGGRTNLGVTQRAWEAYVGGDVDETFMRKLKPEMVKPFYKAMYWDKIKGDDLPSGVDYAAYDFAVNSGVSRSAKFLQRIAGVADDGAIGQKSISAICAINPADMVHSLCDKRLEFLKSLSNFATFGRGWEARVDAVAETGASMVE